ncbi:hypothetical protein BDV30DRAFT_213992 [Aspergillus minisclerotigenes]|uniref:Uncharacterized protein n=1 Tax=Aspergillus minisclerotigenes TaxID=656917 RepID=A0A5N6IZ86_9EURO|nr:hypothetical protein BDV30DRAFT_213992 [Aspergillus minisclerotigenes]
MTRCLGITSYPEWQTISRFKCQCIYGSTMAVESTLPNFLIACLIPYCVVTVHLALSFPLTAYFQILSCLTHLSTCFLEGPGNWAAWAETMCGPVGGSAAVQRIAYAYSRISMLYQKETNILFT